MMQPDIGEPAIVNRGERLRHPVHERLGADEPDARMTLCLPDQVLGATEANFQTHMVHGVRKQCTKLVWRWARQIERKLRQQRAEQLGLPRTQRMPFAAAEERAVMMLAHLTDCRPGRSEAESRDPSIRIIGPCGRAIWIPDRPSGVREDTEFQNALRRLGARSVFSQEKPPSFSGARPK